MLSIDAKRKILRDYIKRNPNCTCRNIRRNTKLRVERVYGNLKNAYRDAGVVFSKNLTKRNREEQIRDAINFIKENPGCTVIDIYNGVMVTIPRVLGSIEKAYKMANVHYIKRKTREGAANPKIIKRAKLYEQKIIDLLKNIGEVQYQKRISNNVIDGIFIYHDKKFIVEIKDYRSIRNITKSEIKQLFNYMILTKIKDGLLICPQENLSTRKFA